MQYNFTLYIVYIMTIKALFYRQGIKVKDGKCSIKVERVEYQNQYRRS